MDHLVLPLAGVGDFLDAVDQGWQRDEASLSGYEMHPRLERFVAYCRRLGATE